MITVLCFDDLILWPLWPCSAGQCCCICSFCLLPSHAPLPFFGVFILAGRLHYLCSHVRFASFDLFVLVSEAFSTTGCCVQRGRIGTMHRHAASHMLIDAKYLYGHLVSFDVGVLVIKADNRARKLL